MSASRQSLGSKPLRRPSTCPTCGAKRVVRVIDDIVLRVGDRRYRLDRVAHEHCEACGERILGTEAARQFDALVLCRKRGRAA